MIVRVVDSSGLASIMSSIGSDLLKIVAICTSSNFLHTR